MSEIECTVTMLKTDRRLGIVFGYGMVCKTRDDAGVVQDYYDLHGDHAPEEEMVKAAAEFAQSARVGKVAHGQNPAYGDARVGTVLFCFPMTEDIAKAMDFPPLKQYGLLVGFMPSDAKLMDAVDAGEFTGFSFGGTGVRTAVST